MHERRMRARLPGARRHPRAAGGRGTPPRPAEGQRGRGGRGVTLAAAERLDDAALLETADPSSMLRQVASSAAQVREAARSAAEASLDELLAGGRPRAIVVIAVSCSGATEETLSAAEEAVRRGCRLLAVGSEGSALAALAEQARAGFICVKPSGMPRSMLWGLSVPLVVAAARLGVLDMPEQAYESAAVELERVAHLCRPDSDAFVNPAKSLALELSGTLPMIWGTSPLTGVAAARFACQLHENGKYPAIAGVLPEANHNQVVVFDGPFAPGPETAGLAATGLAAAEPRQAPPVPLRLIMLRDTHEHPQVSRRREESARIAADRGIEVTELAAAGDQPLERLASLVQLIDYASVYLAIANGIDPAPIAAIQELKARIA